MKILNISAINPNISVSFKNNRAKSQAIEKTDGFLSSSNKAEIYLQLLARTLKDKDLTGEKVLDIQKAISKLNPQDKKHFIELYCKRTGFPNMEKTSFLIANNVQESLFEASNKTGVEIIFAGYNPTCSVGNGHALPGSDFDTFFICLKDWNNFDSFKEAFVDNIDPLLCSMTRTRTNDLPDYVAIEDIINSIVLAQSAFDSHSLQENSKQYKENLNKQIKDWTQAGQYNLDLNDFIDDKNKTPLLRAGLLMEILRDGKIVVDNLDDSTKEFFQNSCVYKYTNMQQMRSYKNAPLKLKHQNREAILSNFNQANDDEKLDLIFGVINLSVKDLKSKVDPKYQPMFQDAGCGNMEDLMQPLLSNKHRLAEYKNPN
ncbi:MAG: hypothetical protein IJB79_06240 [Candidatus Gastranaerophilales bacterium]|nr:hypothetical protein [Candidatus Gastranaerophilales bacterium]